MSKRKFKKRNIQKNVQRNEEDVLRGMYNHYLDTPLELLEILKSLNNCRKFLQYQNVEDWITMFMSYLGYFTVIGREYKERILYALTFVLRDLYNPLFTIGEYLTNTDTLLEKVISIAEEEQGWKLDKISGLGLCAKIVEDYTYGQIGPKDQEKASLESTGKENIIYVEEKEDTSPLRQIIRSYPNTAISKIFDPVWAWYYEQLLVKHDGDEDFIEELYDLTDLENKVRRREILPKIYKKCIWN